MTSSYDRGKILLRGSYSEYTPTGKAYFTKNKAYGKIPKPGSIVYFYSKDMGRVSHVGAVIFVEKKGNNYTIRTVEGNTSSGKSFDRNGGEVALKEYTFNQDSISNGNRIDGFGYPDYGTHTCTSTDFISVLLKEVGYVEKASNKDLNDFKANPGKNNYTKYGEWYGDNGAYWCQQFISWCAYKACEVKSTSNKNGWIKNNDKWQFFRYNNPVSNEWIYDGGQWYVLDGAGFMIKGWFKSEDDWYYMNPDNGSMVASQWVAIDNNDYYFSKSGVMAKNCYIKGNNKYFWINDQGIYLKEYDTTTPDLDNYELCE